MPFDFDHATTCPACPYGKCYEDRRVDKVRNRETKFRLNQRVMLQCTFDAFVPGIGQDPTPTRRYDEYLDKLTANAVAAGEVEFGTEFKVSDSAIAKVEGDAFELLEAAAFWAAAAAWNEFMQSGVWTSTVFTQPPGAVATPRRMVAIVQLPRGYEATKLFKPNIRSDIRAHESALKLRGMELGLSSPDIVGVRLPYPLPTELDVFRYAIPNFRETSLKLLETAHTRLEDKVESNGFLFAIAVKRTTRSDRLYQPLFEANALKYLIEFVLRGAAFRFYAHMGSFEGADVVERYKAASLMSLIRGGTPEKVVDVLHLAERPRESAQALLNDFPLFPH